MESRRKWSWVVWVLLFLGVAVAAMWFWSTGTTQKVRLKVTAYSVTPTQLEEQSGDRRRPSARGLNVLWTQTLELDPGAPVAISQATGSHTIRFEFIPHLSSGSGRVGYEKIYTESFGARTETNAGGPFRGFGGYGPGSWETYRGRISTFGMGPAETVGRGPGETETLYGFEGLETDRLKRILPWR